MESSRSSISDKPTSAAEPLSISVLITTRNRASSLRVTLDSLMLPGNLAQPDWEIIVADNGSSDGTVALCEEFRERYPRHFRFLIDLRAGKSNALNMAIDASRGQILAMIDDDVICDAGYLSGVRSFSQGFRQVAQGRTFVDYLGDRPKWFDRHFDEMMGLIDMGDKACDLPRGFWGLNVIMHRDASESVGGFCPLLGAGTAVGFLEDGEYTKRLRRAGYQVLYAPQFVVRHQVSAYRLSLRYMLTRSYKLGISVAYFEPGRHGLFIYSLFAAKELLVRSAGAIWFYLTKRPSKAARGLCEAAERAGFVIQKWRFQFHGQPRLPVPTLQSSRNKKATA